MRENEVVEDVVLVARGGCGDGAACAGSTRDVRSVTSVVRQTVCTSASLGDGGNGCALR